MTIKEMRREICRVMSDRRPRTTNDLAHALHMDPEEKATKTKIGQAAGALVRMGLLKRDAPASRGGGDLVIYEAGT